MSAFETGNKLRIGPNGEEMTRTSLTTNSLKVLDLANVQAEAICIQDIAHGLSQHVRWAGQGKWLTVAQHSIMVLRMIEEDGRAHGWDGSDRFLRQALMHDAHEAYIGDLSGGLKYLLRGSELKGLILDLNLAIEYAIPNLDMDTLGGDGECLTWAEEFLVPIEYGYLFQEIRTPIIEGAWCARISEELFLSEAARLGMYERRAG